MARDRIIGTYGKPGSGPLVIAIAGLHGNEPAGVNALERVFQYLHRYEIELDGFFVGLAGNLPALEQEIAQIRARLTTDPTVVSGVNRAGAGPVSCCQRY